jgi:tRNA pseudouridine55 synthase
MTDSGILVLDKTAGITSHDAVAGVRRVFGTRRVGHAGTLDPMATGVLVLGINNATRILGQLSGTMKEYYATIKLGAESDSDDSDGVIGSIFDAAGISDFHIIEALNSQRGVREQVPSSVSAVKIDGKRAYDRVRRGEEVSIAPRIIDISELEVFEITRESPWVNIRIRVVCSAGTYIRAIARDLGRALGVGGHLSYLRRTRVGPFEILSAVSIEELSKLDAPYGRLIPVGVVASQLWPVVEVDAETQVRISHGQRLPVDGLPEAPLLGILNSQQELLALAEVTSEGMKYKAVFVGGS